MKNKGERYNIMGRSSRSKVLRGVLVALVFVGAFLFFFVGILTNHATKKMNLRHWKLIRRDRDSHGLHWNPNLINVSKRRVPNGPDPIHNRFIASYFLVVYVSNELYAFIIYESSYWSMIN